MTLKQTTKRCHWVPKAYLRTFAADCERRKVWRFSKQTDEAELKPIEKVAVRFHLYVPMDVDGRRDDSFEQKLAELEQCFAEPPWRTLCNGFPDLSDVSLRKMVSLLAATMFLRNPRHFDYTRYVHGRMVQFYSSFKELPDTVEINGKERIVDTSNWHAYRRANEDDLKRIWISEINNATHYARLFMDMRWSMLVADQSAFVATDNPITFIHPSLLFKGIKDPQTRIIFPVSPTRLLCLDHMHWEPANQYYALKGSAAPHNLLLLRGSIEHMFSDRHPNNVIAEFLKEAERS